MNRKQLDESLAAVGAVFGGPGAGLLRERVIGDGPFELGARSGAAEAVAVRGPSLSLVQPLAGGPAVPFAEAKKAVRSSFSPRRFADPALRQALARFCALAPASGMRAEGELGWSLELEPGLSWPEFLRCDVSAGFAALSSQWSLVLLDREVRELRFRDDGLWVFLRG